MATNTVQYPDGRQEIINVPKAFSVGDVVAVTHRRDGGVVVQKCGAIWIPTGTLYHPDVGDPDEEISKQFKCWIKTAPATFQMRFTLTFNDDTKTVYFHTDETWDYHEIVIDFPGYSGLKNLKIEVRCESNYIMLDDMTINSTAYTDWGFEDEENSEFVWTGNAEKSDYDPRTGVYAAYFYANIE